MTCIIIDDNEVSIKTLKKLIAYYCPQVTVTGFSQTIQEALPLINKSNPDVIFLDVEMNGETGFDLLQFFPNPKFKIVFTTAHEKYALPAIKNNCYDFLLKPIDIKELVSCISKIEQGVTTINDANDVTINNSLVKKIAFITATGLSFINEEDIVCFKADGKYTQITTNQKQTYTSSKSLGEIESTLSSCFFRSHKSSIINLNYVTAFDKIESVATLINDIFMEVSFRKKDEFLQQFTKF